MSAPMDSVIPSAVRNLGRRGEHPRQSSVPWSRSLVAGAPRDDKRGYVPGLATTYLTPSPGFAFIILSTIAFGSGGAGGFGRSALIASATTFGSTPRSLAMSASDLPAFRSAASSSSVIPSALAAAASSLPPGPAFMKNTPASALPAGRGPGSGPTSGIGKPGGRPASFAAS